MGISWHYEPLATVRPPRYRASSKFKTAWSRTVDLLERELKHLGVSRAVIQVDADRSQFRLDGFLRADARTRSPAVAISFKSRHGHLTYPCDTYNHWQDNIRAIALALEALRTVDRYGVTSNGEQYTGWAALPPPASSEFASESEVWIFLRTIIGGRVEVVDRETAIRECEMVTHPDRGGNPDDFKRVQAARAFLLGGKA